MTRRLTIRARLTLVYSGLFLCAGLLLLAITYLLLAQRWPGPATHTLSIPPATNGESAPTTSLNEVASLNQVAEDTWQDALSALLTQGGLALALVALVATAFGWLLAGRLLQPLHQVTETARRIARAPAADRGLHERIALPGPRDEVTELADTFDVMLARLDQAFDGQRRFIANASHELRTPLTVNRVLLETALHRTAGTPDRRQLDETLLDMNAKLERLLDGLLLLARSEREVTELSYVDLADVVEHVVDQLAPGPVTVTVTAGEAPTMGHPALLERLVQNLVDNAVRYNIDPDGWVRVLSGASTGGMVMVTVSNTGPVIPGYDIPRLFEPFHRGGDRVATASAGTGLGLSIVRAVAHAHGGEVHAEPRDGGGLTVTVTLPAAD